MTSLRGEAWQPLRVAAYRTLWFAALSMNLTSFVQITAAGWSMAQLTDSPLLIGLVQTLWALPGFLLSLHAGVIADLVDRRRLIVTTYGAGAALTGAIAVLEVTGAQTPVALLVGTFVTSVVLTLGTPAVMASTADLVDPPMLGQALGLDGMSRNLAQTAGPALAGAAALAGTAAPFALGACGFLAVALLGPRLQLAPPVTGRAGGLTRSIRTGLSRALSARRARHVAVRMVLTGIAMSSVVALVPVLATSTLDVDAGGFGLLYGALGTGAVLVVPVLPRLRRALHDDLLSVAGGIVWALGAVGLAVAPSISIVSALAALALAGAGMMVQSNVLFTALLTGLDGGVRGIGTGLAVLSVWSGQAVGAVAWGAVAAGWSAPTALVVAAASNVAVVVVALRAAPVRAGGS
jgi:MFS family permease